MRLKISTIITVGDNISKKYIENIKNEFEDVAWENNMVETQPSVTIEELN